MQVAFGEVTHEAEDKDEGKRVHQSPYDSPTKQESLSYQAALEGIVWKLKDISLIL